MAQFSDIYNNIADQFQDTSTAMITRIKRYINWCQQDITSRRAFSYLLKKTFVQLTATYTTGTVTVTNASATVTGSGTTFTSGMEGRKFRVDSGDEYYTILTYVSATEITLSQTYVGTTASAQNYTIFQDEYSLASDTEKVVNMMDPTNSTKLAYIPRQEFDARFPNPQSYGVPTYWTEAGRDSNNYLKAQFYTIPDSTYIIWYWYRKKLTDLSADSDISLIPTKYHQALYYGALAQAYEYDENPLANNYRVLYENMINDMIDDLESGSEDSVITLRSTDDIKPTFNPVKFPSDHFEN